MDRLVGELERSEPDGAPTTSSGHLATRGSPYGTQNGGGSPKNLAKEGTDPSDRLNNSSSAQTTKDVTMTDKPTAAQPFNLTSMGTQT